MTKLEECIYDEIIALGIATEEEISLVKCIRGGFWEDVLNDIICARTGYRSLEELYEEEFEEEEDEEE